MNNYFHFIVSEMEVSRIYQVTQRVSSRAGIQDRARTLRHTPPRSGRSGPPRGPPCLPDRPLPAASCWGQRLLLLSQSPTPPGPRLGLIHFFHFSFSPHPPTPCSLAFSVNLQLLTVPIRPPFPAQYKAWSPFFCHFPSLATAQNSALTPRTIQNK